MSVPSSFEETLGSEAAWWADFSSAETERVLVGRAVGTYLIRFSKSLGKCIISWVANEFGGVHHAVLEILPNRKLQLQSSPTAYSTLVELIASHSRTLVTPYPCPRRNLGGNDENNETASPSFFSQHTTEVDADVFGARSESRAPLEDMFSPLAGFAPSSGPNDASSAARPTASSNANVLDFSTPFSPRDGSSSNPQSEVLFRELVASGLHFRNGSRQDAERELLHALPGDYVVRPSSQAGCIALTYVCPLTATQAQICHLLLLHTPGQGWTTDSRPIPFPNARDLLLSLPFNLKIDRAAPQFAPTDQAGRTQDKKTLEFTPQPAFESLDVLPPLPSLPPPPSENVDSNGPLSPTSPKSPLDRSCAPSPSPSPSPSPLVRSSGPDSRPGAIRPDANVYTDVPLPITVPGKTSQPGSGASTPIRKSLLRSSRKTGLSSLVSVDFRECIKCEQCRDRAIQAKVNVMEGDDVKIKLLCQQCTVVLSQEGKIIVHQGLAPAGTSSPILVGNRAEFKLNS